MSTTLTLLLANDSIHVLHDGPPSPILPCTFLSIILVSSLFLNSFLFLSLVFTSLRSTLFNVLLSYLAGMNLVDTLVSLTISVAVRASWQDLYLVHGEQFLRILCRLNAAIVQFSNVVHSCLLAVLSLERNHLLSASTKQPQEEEVGKTRVLRIFAKVAPTSGAVAAVAVVPLLVGVIATRMFDRRYSCSPAHVSLDVLPLICSVLLLLAGHVVPWLATCRAWFTIARRILKERRRLRHLELVAHQRAVERRSPVLGLSSSLGLSGPSSWSQIWGPVHDSSAQGFRYFMLALGLVGLHVGLVVPSVLLVQVSMVQQNYQVVLEDNHLLPRNMSLKLALPDDLAPVETNAADCVFTWTRFIFLVASPLLIISVHREVKRECLKMVGCCSRHNVIGLSHVRSVSAYVQDLKEKENRRKQDNQRRRNSEKYRRVADFATPVLFATSEGLHLRTFETESSFEFSRLTMSSSSKTLLSPTDRGFVCTFCDLSVAAAPSEQPSQRRQPLPTLSKTPPLKRSLGQDLKLEDSHPSPVRERKGKVVRFAQRVSEIPLTESGIFSSDEQANSSDSSKSQPSFNETFTLADSKKALTNSVLPKVAGEKVQ